MLQNVKNYFKSITERVIMTPRKELFVMFLKKISVIVLTTVLACSMTVPAFADRAEDEEWEEHSYTSDSDEEESLPVWNSDQDEDEEEESLPVWWTGQDEEEKSDDEKKESSEDEDEEYTEKNYLGNFTITAYCNCADCCGRAGAPTASGVMPTSGHTVAMGGVDFGTKLLINGTVYTVEDRGTDYGHVDIYFDSHSEALEFGMTTADVYEVK